MELSPEWLVPGRGLFRVSRGRTVKRLYLLLEPERAGGKDATLPSAAAVENLIL